MWAIKHRLNRIRWHDGRLCLVVVHDEDFLKLTDKQALSSYEVRTPWLQLILQGFKINSIFRINKGFKSFISQTKML